MLIGVGRGTGKKIIIKDENVLIKDKPVLFTTELVLVWVEIVPIKDLRVLDKDGG